MGLDQRFSPLSHYHCCQSHGILVHDKNQVIKLHHKMEWWIFSMLEGKLGTWVLVEAFITQFCLPRLAVILFTESELWSEFSLCSTSTQEASGLDKWWWAFEHGFGALTDWDVIIFLAKKRAPAASKFEQYSTTSSSAAHVHLYLKICKWRNATALFQIYFRLDQRQHIFLSHSWPIEFLGSVIMSYKPL